MNQYKCTVCGYIYDEAEGDPDGGLPPGTLYDDIPDSWMCPVCGVTKERFILIKWKSKDLTLLFSDFL